MGFDVYLGAVKDSEFQYTGEPEAWRDNIELITAVPHAGSLPLPITSEESEQLDWATFVLPVSHEEALALIRPVEASDVHTQRFVNRELTDEDLRAKLEAERDRKLAKVKPDGDYLLVAVERI